MAEQLTDKPRKQRTVEPSVYLIQRLDPTGDAKGPLVWEDVASGEPPFEDTADAIRWLKVQSEGGTGNVQTGHYRVVAVRREFHMTVKEETRRTASFE